MLNCKLAGYFYTQEGKHHYEAFIGMNSLRDERKQDERGGDVMQQGASGRHLSPGLLQRGHQLCTCDVCQSRLKVLAFCSYERAENKVASRAVASKKCLLN